jgi:dTDP-4-dehydrorhamnose reductase
MTRVLVTGASGQVGRELQRAAWPSGFGLWPVDHAQLDITEEAAVRALFQSVRPAVVVNAAAYTAVDKAEDAPATAFAVNATGVTHLARAAEQCGAHLLHLSTDYVFDGTKAGWYLESDPVNPLGVYGRSKLDGERAALQCPRAIVLRTAWVYGALGLNFVRTMLRLARERDVIGVVADQVGCPTSARDLAAALVSVACASLDGVVQEQLLHVASPVEATWHELAGAVFRASSHGFDGELRAITTAEYPTRASRPANSRLDSGRLYARLGVRLPDWHDSLAHVVAELEKDPGRTR